MALPAKILFAVGTAFVVGVGMTVSLVPSASKPSIEAKAAPAKVGSTDTLADTPAKPAASARAWVDPVRPAPLQAASTTPAPDAAAATSKPVETASVEPEASPAPVTTPKKRVVAHKPARSVASARTAKSRLARNRAPQDAYADARDYDPRRDQADMSSTIERRDDGRYDPRYRQTAFPYRGAVYADAGGANPYAEERIVRAAPQGGVMRWLMEPGAR